MRRMMAAGNWKMNGSKASTEALLKALKVGVGVDTDIDWVIFPAFPFLAQAQMLLMDTDIALGAQNVSDHVEGAYTGEVSALMLRDWGCHYVIVGHSERRHIYGEDDLLVAAKFQAAYDAGLTPVLCVGETLMERQSGVTEKVVARQLDAVLSTPQVVQQLGRAVIAYEPVWAIGTGETASPEQAQAVHAMIRQRIKRLDADIAEAVRILYGGSVKRDNAEDLFAMPDIDGGLVGGAALNADDFLAIGRSCNN